MKHYGCTLWTAWTILQSIFFVPVGAAQTPDSDRRMDAKPRPDPVRVTAWIREAVAGRDILPSLNEVQEATVIALNGPDVNAVQDLEQRARFRGWIPKLNARLGTSRDLSVRTGELEAVDWVRSGEGLGIQVTMTWNLREILFSEVEVRLHTARLARARAVQRALKQVTEVYFQRIAVLVEGRAHPTVKGALEAARLDGLLRALTGGRLAIPRRRS